MAELKTVNVGTEKCLLIGEKLGDVRFNGREKREIYCQILILRKKAEELRALLVVSGSYRKYASEEFISAYFSMYISKSKAGEQYLDSLGGSNHVDKEGSYERNRFLIDNR